MLDLMSFPALGPKTEVLLEAFNGRPGATAKLPAGGSSGLRVSSCNTNFFMPFMHPKGMSRVLETNE